MGAARCTTTSSCVSPNCWKGPGGRCASTPPRRRPPSRPTWPTWIPHNQHSYRGNYHIWETLCLWDRPEVYGIAKKGIDCRAYRSPFNSKSRIKEALPRVLAALRARHVLVSFSNEGYVSREEIESWLSTRGHFEVVEVDFKRYVGAQIGIYNPQGKKVGKVSHLRNKELLFLVGPDRADVRRAADAARGRRSQPIGSQRTARRGG